MGDMNDCSAQFQPNLTWDSFSAEMRLKGLDLINKNHGIMRTTSCPTIDAPVKEGAGREQNFCRLIEQRMMDFQKAYFNPNMKAVPIRIPPETLGSGIYCEWKITC